MISLDLHVYLGVGGDIVVVVLFAFCIFYMMYLKVPLYTDRSK